MLTRRPPALLLTACLAAAPATAPTASPPATKPVLGDLVSLGDDLVHLYAPPPERWTLLPTKVASVNLAYFQADDKKSAIQFELAAADFQISPDLAGQMAVGIVKSLKEMRRKSGTAVVMQPTIEKDRRFDIVVHERFKVGDNTVDEMHLYKSVGPRTVMVAASSVSDDPDAVAGTFAAAKASLATVKYIKPGTAKTKPKRP